MVMILKYKITPDKVIYDLDDPLLDEYKKIGFTFSNAFGKFAVDRFPIEIEIKNLDELNTLINIFGSVTIEDHFITVNKMIDEEAEMNEI